MTDSTELEVRAGRAVLEVLRRTHLSAPGEIAQVLAEEARLLGAGSLVLYLSDYEQQVLVPIPSDDAAGREPLPIRGTVAGRAFASTSAVEIDGDEGSGRRLWLPLLDGTERYGVADFSFPDHEGPLGEALLAAAVRYAHLAAMMVASKDAYSDVFEVIRRRRPMTVASELLWQNVPPLVLASDDFVLSALLEPCYDNGGDAFDYALNRRALHFAVFDAMGHGLAAASQAAFALSAYRHNRRQDGGPMDAYVAIDTALASHHSGGRFVTALMAELDVGSGHLRWVNAGHPPPLLIRNGRLVKTLDVRSSPPMGMQLTDEAPQQGEEWLEPGDMVALYTDGLIEARRPDGELFSVERLAQFIEREAANGQAAPETLRRLRDAIIASGEGDLRDDATAVLVEWRGGSQAEILPPTV